MLMMTSFMYFNSIKVRLEPTNADDNQLYVGNFNSIKVRLERASFDKLDDFQKNFNSIKVRLELLL